MAEAGRWLTQYGPNEIEAGRRFRVGRTALERLTDPLVRILLAASIGSGRRGEALNAAKMSLIVLLSVALDFFQIFRSKQAARKLRDLTAPTTAVWREGKRMDIRVREVLLGDLLEL